MERRPIQYAAGSLAGSAFIAVTQILTRDTLDWSLWATVTLFAVSIPFQVILFFAPVPPSRHKAQGFAQLHSVRPRERQSNAARTLCQAATEMHFPVRKE